MTATMPKIPDPLTVLRRAERTATGEEPGDLSHLADAIQIQIIQPLTAGTAPAVDKAAFEELKKDLETAYNERDAAREAARHTDTAPLRDEIDKLRHALKLRTTELDEARAERDTARAQVGGQGSAPHGALEQAQNDNARLADELACARRDLRAANKTLDEIADEQETAPATAHVHQHLVPGPGEDAQDCACGQPYPRGVGAVELEEVVADVDPWGDLFGRIREQVAGEGWTP